MKIMHPTSRIVFALTFSAMLHMLSVTKAECAPECEPPSIIEQLPLTARVKIGGRSTLRFKLSDTAAVVKGYKDGEVVEGWTEPALGLVRIRSSDAGIYNAVARNACGEVETVNCQVIVEQAGVMVPQMNTYHIGYLAPQQQHRVLLTNIFKNEGVVASRIFEIRSMDVNDDIVLDTAALNGTVVEPNQSVSVPVLIRSSNPGLRTFTVWLRTDTDVNPTVRCTYVIDNQSHVLRSLQPSLDFGITEFNDTVSRTRIIGIANDGDEAVTVHNMFITGYGASNYTVADPILDDIVLGVDSVLYVTVKYKPEFYGSIPAALTVVTDDEELLVPISAYRNSMSEVFVDCGVVGLGLWKDTIVTFQHEYELSLRVDSIDAMDNSFTILETSPELPANLGPFGVLHVKVRYQPTTNGSHASVARVNWHDVNDNLQFSVAMVLHGEGAGITGVKPENDNLLKEYAVVNSLMPWQTPDIFGDIVLYDNTGRVAGRSTLDDSGQWRVFLGSLPIGIYYATIVGQ